MRFWRIVSSQRASGSSHTGRSTAGQTPATAAQTSTEPSSSRAVAKSRSTSSSTVRSACAIGAPPISAATACGPLLAAVVVHEHLGALGGEEPRAGGADPAGGTGDDDAFACKTRVHEGVGYPQ